MFSTDRIRLVTFGEPRTGNVAFAKAVEDTLKFRYRVVHRDDMVKISNMSFEKYLSPFVHKSCVHGSSK